DPAWPRPRGRRAIRRPVAVEAWRYPRSRIWTRRRRGSARSRPPWEKCPLEIFQEILRIVGARSAGIAVAEAREVPSGAANARALRRCPRRGGETMSSSLLRGDRAKIGDRSRETHSGEMEKPQVPRRRRVLTSKQPAREM